MSPSSLDKASSSERSSSNSASINIDNVTISVPNNKKKIFKSPNALSCTYNNTDLSFVVHVHTSDLDNGKDSSPVNLYPTVVGSILIDIGNDILEIKKSGKGRISVEFRSASAANNLVQNNVLAKHNLKAFIPLHRIMRIGIIKDVPQEIDVNTVKEFLSSPCKVLEVIRLNKRIKVNDSGGFRGYIPRGSQGGRFSAISPAFSSASYANITRVPTANIDKNMGRVDQSRYRKLLKDVRLRAVRWQLGLRLKEEGHRGAYKQAHVRFMLTGSFITKSDLIMSARRDEGARSLCRRLTSQDPFTMNKMRLALAGSKSKSGLDRIDNNIIGALPKDYIKYLLDIFNGILEDGEFPSSWRSSLVIPISKAGNKGYRPISLMSCTLKILERMILRRLKHYVESESILRRKVFNSMIPPEFSYDYETTIHAPDCISLYTDGSKIGEDGPVGTAVHSLHGNLNIGRKFPSAFSVFSAIPIVRNLEEIGTTEKLSASELCASVAGWKFTNSEERPGLSSRREAS
ncbi:RTJK polymerase, partial [Acromyrmex heyeri]